MITLIIPVILLVVLSTCRYLINQYLWYRAADKYKQMRSDKISMPFAGKFDDPRELLKYLCIVKQYSFIDKLIIAILSASPVTSNYARNIANQKNKIHNLIYRAARLNNKKLGTELITTGVKLCMLSKDINQGTCFDCSKLLPSSNSNDFSDQIVLIITNVILGKV